MNYPILQKKKMLWLRYNDLNYIIYIKHKYVHNHQHVRQKIAFMGINETKGALYAAKRIL